MPHPRAGEHRVAAPENVHLALVSRDAQHPVAASGDAIHRTIGSAHTTQPLELAGDALAGQL